MYRETQKTVSDWAEQTFGPAGSNARVAARANEEMAELLRALTANDNHPKGPEEMADVLIILYRLATRFGIALADCGDTGTPLSPKRRQRSSVPSSTPNRDDALGGR